MPRLIVQADDNAISTATALGVMEAVRHGVVRNTGIFTNMPATGETAALLAQVPGLCVGLDLNFVTGRPLSPVGAVADLLGPDGAFRGSGQVRRTYRAVAHAGMVTTFETEPFPYDQTMAEARAQVARFVEVMDRPPAYLHHHALATPATDQVIGDLAAELGVPVPLHLIAAERAHAIPNDWYQAPFAVEDQVRAQPLEHVLGALEEASRHDASILVTHPGYVDAELLELSSFSVVRARDLQMLCDPRLVARLEELGLVPSTYSGL